MKLKTYRIDQKTYYPTGKMVFFKSLHESVLRKDPYWHFFLDWGGATLRFLPKLEWPVRQWLGKNAKGHRMRWKKSTDYDPSRHEYWGVSYLGDDILPLFHDMSVLSIKYPGYVLRMPVLERLNHGLINMAGIHDFRTEAEIYLDLAFSRGSIVHHTFRLPYWVYKFFIRLSGEKKQ